MGSSNKHKKWYNVDWSVMRQRECMESGVFRFRWNEENSDKE
jgi:hypothetical protein